MKTTQPCDSTLLVSLALMFGGLLWLLSDYLPADATELQALVALATPNPDAKTALAESLRETPNPNRVELRRMRSRVNGILLTATARAVTGNKALETPSDRRARVEREQQARLAQLEAKPWSELSNDERALVAASKWPIAAYILGIVVVAAFGWRIVHRAQQGF